MDRDKEIEALEGLSDAEVRQRLDAEGYNELPSTKKRTVFAILWDESRCLSSSSPAGPCTSSWATPERPSCS